MLSIILAILMFFALVNPRELKSQETHVTIPSDVIDGVNRSIPEGWFRLVSVSIQSLFQGGTSYLKGNVDLRCNGDSRLVRTNLVIPEEAVYAEVATTDSMRQRGFEPITPNSLIGFLSSSKEDRGSVIRQAVLLGAKICNSPSGRGEYIALAVWSDRNSRNVYLPRVVYQTIDARKYRDLTTP